MDSCLRCTRRTALTVAVVACLPRRAFAKCAVKGVDLGAQSAFPAGTFRLFETELGRIVVARDGAGLYAYSAMCTHMAGAVSVDDKGMGLCASHGSLFGPHGEVVRGPALRPLPHFFVELCEGRVWVDATRVVEASTRVG